jgi:hypothetical protein
MACARLITVSLAPKPFSLKVRKKRDSDAKLERQDRALNGKLMICRSC